MMKTKMEIRNHDLNQMKCQKKDKKEKKNGI